MGGGRVPTLGDRSALPYCDATIMEIQRLACVAPGSIPHVANEDGYLAGYKIPKGTILLYNITYTNFIWIVTRDRPKAVSA